MGLATVETVRAPLLVLDEGFRIRLANPAFRTTYGLAEGDLVGRNFFEIGTGEWNEPQLRELLVDLLPSRAEIRDLKVRIHPGEGEPRTLVVNARQMQFHGEGRSLIVLSLEDMTRQAALEAAVGRHTREMERSNRELEEFAHAASHDLQEPLRKVRTYATRLADGLDPACLDERQREYVVRMTQAVERMQTRIDDMIRLARVGRTRPQPEEVELEALVRTVVEDLEPAIEAAGARIEVGPLPTLRADPAQLRLLFQNLLSNAIKFRREGSSPRVRVLARRPEPEVAGGAQPGLQVVVEDDGIGFDQEYAHRIFIPFERLHPREAFEGTGIGLSICRRVMENHEGEIRAESRPGEGARFLLTFPHPGPHSAVRSDP